MFEVARPGDHTLCPFQCHTCQIRNLFGRDPEESATDIVIQALHRRYYLDLFWSRKKSTVAKHVTTVRSQLKLGGALGVVRRLFPPLGPIQLGNDQGFAQGLTILYERQAYLSGPHLENGLSASRTVGSKALLARQSSIWMERE